MNVDDYARWGVGLYQVTGSSTGPGLSCSGIALVRVEGNPLSTPEGGPESASPCSASSGWWESPSPRRPRRRTSLEVAARAPGGAGGGDRRHGPAAAVLGPVPDRGDCGARARARGDRRRDAAARDARSRCPRRPCRSSTAGGTRVRPTGDRRGVGIGGPRETGPTRSQSSARPQSSTTRQPSGSGIVTLRPSQ